MYIAGLTPTPIRQTSAAAFSGVTPQNSDPVTFEPFVVNGIVTYVNPSDHTEAALVQGGLYDFGSTPTKIYEIRALTANGNISAVISDKADQKTVGFTVGGATPAIDFSALGVVAGDIITVTTTGSSLTETYTVDSVVSATVLRTVEMVTDRDLVATDVFTITNFDGNTSKYAHTLAGVDTLDLDVATTHDTPIGTPATSRLTFEAHPVVTPNQVLKVSTVSASALGWLDVYAVKGDIY